MARVFGCISNQPQRLGEALAPIRDALVARGPVARWGVGYVQSDEVLLSLHPREVRDRVDFYPVLSSLASDNIIGAADVEDGLGGQTNTQPFRFRRWMFAQENAAGADPGPVLAEIAQHIPDFLRRNLRGRSPSEHFFHLFLARLHDEGALDDVDLAPRSIRAALAATASLVVATASRVGVALAPGNLVLSNSRGLVALRLGGPLFVRRLKQQTDPRRPESQFRSVLVVSTEESPGDGFEDLPPRSALAINRDVTTDVVDLDA
jgi:hypothetical protein